MALRRSTTQTATPTADPDRPLYDDGPTLTDLDTPGLWYVPAELRDGYLAHIGDRRRAREARINAEASDFQREWMRLAWARILPPDEYAQELAVLDTRSPARSRLNQWPDTLTEMWQRVAFLRHLFTVDHAANLAARAADNLQWEAGTRTNRTCSMCGHVDLVHGPTTVTFNRLPWTPEGDESPKALTCPGCRAALDRVWLDQVDKQRLALAAAFVAKHAPKVA